MWSKEKKMIQNEEENDTPRHLALHGPEHKEQMENCFSLCVHVVSFLLFLVFNKPLVIRYHWVDKFDMTKSKCLFVTLVLTCLFIYKMVLREKSWS